MNKAEFVAAIAESAEISKKDAEKALKAFVDVITEELKKGEKIQYLRELRERVGILRRSRRSQSLLLKLLSSRLVRL